MLTDFMQLNSWINYRRKRFWVLVLLVLYTFSGFVVAPWLLSRFGPELGADFTQRELSLGEISFNPWTLRLVGLSSLMIWFTVAATGRWIGFSG